ncbi:MAG: carboxypeptidase-like regulatory domain-containing protein [Terriglobales bacterium]
MKLSAIALIAALLRCATVSGRAVASPGVLQSFHVGGTITDPLDAVVPGVEVTFDSGQVTRTTTTNANGKYEIDLPLGRYTMRAERRFFRTYRRPLFLVLLPAEVTFDISLPVEKIVNRVVVGKLVQPPNYYGEEFLPVSSRDGGAFQLYVRYTTRASIDDGLDYSGEKAPYEDPVFVAYNLCAASGSRRFQREAKHP